MNKEELECILNKYGLKIDINGYILKYGDIIEIDKILNFLINILKIDKRSIEKCPSILYKNTKDIIDNIKFLEKSKIKKFKVDNCLHILSTPNNRLCDTYNYVIEKYGESALNRIPSILSKSVYRIKSIESLNLDGKFDVLKIATGINNITKIREIVESREFLEYPNLFTSSVLADGDIDEIIKIINSKEFQENQSLISSTVLAHSNIKKIREILESKEFRDNRELFTSTVLAHGKLDKIKKILGMEEFKKNKKLLTSQVLVNADLEELEKILGSQEFKDNKGLFTSEVLAHSNYQKIKVMLNSREYIDNKGLFTSEVLSRGNFKEIKKILNSNLFIRYKHLFTSQVLARKSYDEIVNILESREFLENEDLFTSQVLAYSNIDRIKSLLNSQEFKDNRGLFTSQVLAHGDILKIKAILKSDAFKNHKDIFTSEVLLANSLEKIQEILELPYWNVNKYKHLLTSGVLTRKKETLIYNFNLAEEYGFSDVITVNYLKKSPNQNHAILCYLFDNNLSLYIDGKLNPIFAYQPGILKKKYGIDIHKLMENYPLNNKIL